MKKKNLIKKEIIRCEKHLAVIDGQIKKLKRESISLTLHYNQSLPAVKQRLILNKLTQLKLKDKQKALEEKVEEHNAQLQRYNGST